MDEPPSNDGSVEIVRTGKAERSGESVDFSEPYSVRDSATRERVPASETETDAVVRRIKELLAERVEVTDDSGATRSVSRWTYDDIVVLVRTRSESAMRLARKLRGAGIPVSLSARLAPTEGRCNRLLISFLRLLDNFRDDVALTAVMRSVIGGFTDGELADCRAADAAAPFWMCVLKKAETGRQVPRVHGGHSEIYGAGRPAALGRAGGTDNERKETVRVRAGRGAGRG